MSRIHARFLFYSVEIIAGSYSFEENARRLFVSVFVLFFQLVLDCWIGKYIKSAGTGGLK